VINFFGVCNALGYGVFTYELMKACSRITDIAFHPVIGSNPPDKEDINSWIQNGREFKKGWPSIVINHIPFLHHASGDPLIGFPIFEQEKFSEEELAILRSMDMIFQPSEWGRRVLNAHGLENVHVVRGGYNEEVYTNDISLVYKMNRIEEHGVTFVHIGKYEERKRSKHILQSFVRGVEDKKSTLIYHVINPFNPQWFQEISSYLKMNGYVPQGTCFRKDKATIIIPETRNGISPASLYRMSDFGLWASLSEGWNLPLLECLASGVPCLCTRYGGQSEFITEDYPSELILNDDVPADMENKIWGMIHDPLRYLGMSNQCYETVKDFTWNNAATRVPALLRHWGVPPQ
jgi:glycosyltransferase involved in cell wall biosynthesis